MMTQDRASHGVGTSTSPRNLNPTAPAFYQNQGAPFSPQNLNPTAVVFQQSPTGDRSPSDIMYSRLETGQQGLLANGDISANGTTYLMPVGAGGASMLRESSPQSHVTHQIQSMQSSMGLSLAPHPTVANNHQPVVSTQQQTAYGMTGPDNMSVQQIQKHTRASSHISPYMGNGESYENPPNDALGGDEDVPKTTGHAVDLGGRQEYPEEVLAPIRKQMQFYFSNENLPNDKFLNQHMDMDKYIPLELFLDFGRIKPICNSVDQLTKAVESSSILELSEDRKRVRVSQCRKTLTLRGFPQSATDEDVRQFLLEMGAYAPTHIEFVMFKDKYSVWYVSFKDEMAALNSFFQLHNQTAVYKDHTIGCCIKSSGTLAAAGYFPSTEDSTQRRLAYQNQVAASVPAPVHTVQNTIPQPQQPQAMIQPFSAMQLHSYLPGSPTNIYYQQTPQGSYMPYMAGMIHGWPGATAPMEPGLIMQNNGLQPQHIRTSMPRAHIMPPGSANQHRFNRPQRPRQNNLEGSTSERPTDRSSLMSVSLPSRSSPQIADNNAAVVPQGAYVPRHVTVPEDVIPSVIPPSQVLSHQFVTPLVTQQQQQHAVTTSAAIANPTGLESVAVLHYQPAHHQRLPHHQPLPHPQHHQHHHQHSVMVQTAVTDTATAPPPPTTQIASNLPPNTQHIHQHHIQPPPQVPQQQQQQQHHHHQQQPQSIHQHHQQQQTSHHVQHSNQNHHFPQPLHPPPQPYHQQPPSQPNHHQQHHSHQQHNMVSPHHHHSQQQHHQYLPPKAHHHQHIPPGNRSDKRNRRKKEDNIKNQRTERSQSTRASFSSQALAVTDNFTMEANSFPPLPGALNNITNSEVSHENRMSDIVRGVTRNPGLNNYNIPRASSTTPSPVATPTPVSMSMMTASGLHHGLHGSAIVDNNIVDNGDLTLDDDVTSSSQEDGDTDINTFESRSVRSEQHSLPSTAEPVMLPSQTRFQKVSAPVTSPATVMSHRQSENRQGSVPTQAEGKGPSQSAYNHQQHHQTSPATVSALVLTSEAPKLSYAQILAQKNHEASSSSGSGENLLGGNLSSGTSYESNLSNDGNAALTTGGNRTSAQATNAFREHGNYQGGQHHGSRSSQRGLSKDGISISEDPPPSSRQPNGSRRNSKENRTSNKFERRKPDSRQK